MESKGVGGHLDGDADDNADLSARSDAARDICSLSNLIGRYWNATMPPESIASGGNTPILVYLGQHADEEIFQYDIERQFSIAKSTASRVLSLMEKKGLVERQSVERDARLRRIVLTDEGRNITRALDNNATRLETILFDGMDSGEQDRVLSALERMQLNLVATSLVGQDGDGKTPRLEYEEDHEEREEQERKDI